MSAGIAERIVKLFDGELPATTDWLTWLRKSQLDQLPMPGKGSTLERWRALAAVAQFDLSLSKLFEGHTDALAIMEELDPERGQVPEGAWGVWAAETTVGRATLHPGAGSSVLLGGAKQWCSGALTADHALLTAWDVDGRVPHLVAVALKQPGVVVDAGQWKAVGMAGSMSVRVAFSGAAAQRVGKPGAYLSRPGFWQGGAGIAACWHGGAIGLAAALRESLLAPNAGEVSGFKMASLGKVELAIGESAATLRESAAWIDDHPFLDASRVALTARLSTERCAKRVMDEVGKAMGASPFCLDEKFAKAAADLPVFIRQSHADRDFAALGERSLMRGTVAWRL